MKTLDSNPRFARAVAIVNGGGVRELRRNLWSVKSASHAGSYLVDLQGEIPGCTCPDHDAHASDREHRCKHTFAALITAKQIEIPTTMKRDRKPTYRQHWASYTYAQEHEREHFDRLLHDLCSGIKAPVQRRGRPRMPLADVVFAIVTQAYVNRSGRRTVSEVRSAAAAGLVDQSMSSKTISKYLNDQTISDLLRQLVRESASPLACVETRFAVDATGLSTCQHVRWFDEKHGRTRTKKKFVKLHACVGTHTGIFSDVLVTDSKGEGSGDVNNLPSLVQGTAENFSASEVSADGAYLSRNNLDAIEAIGAVPFVPFRAGNIGEGPPAWRRAWARYVLDAEAFKRHYHQRSNSEAQFSALKRKFGPSLRTRTLVAQRNEILARCIAHNITILVRSMFDLGITAEFWGSVNDGGVAVSIDHHDHDATLGSEHAGGEETDRGDGLHVLAVRARVASEATARADRRDQTSEPVPGVHVESVELAEGSGDRRREQGPQAAAKAVARRRDDHRRVTCSHCRARVLTRRSGAMWGHERDGSECRGSKSWDYSV